MNYLGFFKTFLKDKNIGAITPTSKYAVKKICERMDFSKDIVIVEYGPGNGVFSKFFLEKMSPKSKLIALETNPDFYKFLQHIHDPRFFIFHDTAENIQQILEQCHVSHANYVVSGIPFSFFTPELRQNIVAHTWESLTKNGKFLVYQYSLLMTKELEKRFERVHTDITVLNIPPIFIMEATK